MSYLLTEMVVIENLKIDFTSPPPEHVNVETGDRQFFYHVLENRLCFLNSEPIRPLLRQNFPWAKFLLNEFIFYFYEF